MALFAGLFIALILGWIGASMLRLKGWEHKVAGTIIALTAGVVIVIGASHVDDGTWKQLDHENCIAYAWIEPEQNWRCITGPK